MATAAIAGVQALGSVAGGIASGKGAKKAAKIAAQTADKDRAFAQQINNQNVALATPIYNRGNAAGTQLNALLGLGGDTTAANNALAAFQNSTGYQTTVANAMKAVNQQYAAAGALDSGAAQKALQNRAAYLGQQSLGQYTGLLQGQQNAGLSALGSITGSNQNLVTNVTNANNSAGQTAAQASLYNGYSTQNALAGLAGSAADYLSQSSYKKQNQNPYNYQIIGLN